MVEWKIVGTDEFLEWFRELQAPVRRAVMVRIEVLRAAGPRLGRPYVDTIRGSRLKNLKELRVPKNAIRVLFAFDPKRRAILLCGGSKEGEPGFYRRMIPLAEKLVQQLTKKGKEDAGLEVVGPDP